jgi:hypothetical protein
VATPEGELGLLDVVERGTECTLAVPAGRWRAVRLGADPEGRPMVLLACARTIRAE